MTHALDQARANPSINVIKVWHSVRPIAPLLFGEDESNPALRGLEPSFPLILPAGVQLVGIASGANKPRMLVNETRPVGDPVLYDFVVPSNYTLASPPPPPPPAPQTVPFRNAYVLAASNSSVDGFLLDGTKLRFKADNIDGWNVGLLAENYRVDVGGGVIEERDVIGFTIANCTIADLYDGIVWSRRNAGTTSGSVRDTVVSDCFPHRKIDAITDPLDPLFHEQGHAAVWLETHRPTPGNSGAILVDVDTTGCTFERNHDAVETGGDPGISDATIRYYAFDCTFQCNENGIEAVGPATCDIDIQDCRFLRNVNRPDAEGGYRFTPTAAIITRLKPASITVRRSIFRDNAISVLAGSAATTLDFGTFVDNPAPEPDFVDPGLNSFSYTRDAFGEPIPELALEVVTDPNRRYFVNVHLMRDAQMTAYGNRWFGSNQDFDQDGLIAPSLGLLCAQDSNAQPGVNCESYPDPSTHDEFCLPPPSTAKFAAARNFALSWEACIDFGALFSAPGCPWSSFPVCDDTPTAACPCFVPPAGCPPGG
ncbi:MAG: hypothetical protein ACKVWV_04375 [Planctomycetota bacterium]